MDQSDFTVKWTEVALVPGTWCLTSRMYRSEHEVCFQLGWRGAHASVQFDIHTLEVRYEEMPELTSAGTSSVDWEYHDAERSVKVEQGQTTATILVNADQHHADVLVRATERLARARYNIRKQRLIDDRAALQKRIDVLDKQLEADRKAYILGL